MPRTRLEMILPACVTTLSGAGALMLQTLWFRETSQLFGSSAAAAATTFGAFFIGLAGGGLVGARLALRVRNAPLWCAAAELGAAGLALLSFALAPLVLELPLPGPDALPGYALGLIRGGLSLALFLGPAVCIGAAFPLLIRAFAPPTGLPATTALLYMANTLAAAAGAFFAGILLPEHLAYSRIQWISVALLACAGLIALSAARRFAPTNDADGSQRVLDRDRVASPDDARQTRALAFLTGAVMIAYETAGIRLLAKVLQNSVQTFALIVIVFILAFAISAGIAAWLIRRRSQAQVWLPLLSVTAAACIVAAPFIFMQLTRLENIDASGGFAMYLLRAWLAAALILGPGAIVGGTLFPYLFRELSTRSSGTQLGALLAWNYAGCAAGGATCALALLPTVGVYGVFAFLGGCLALLAFWFAATGRRAGNLSAILAAAGAGIVLSLLSWLNPGALDTVRIKPGAILVQRYNGASGTVAVIQEPDNRKLVLNNNYTLGDWRARDFEQRQADLPLLMHPHPRSVFFIGLGTGITATAALDHAVERIDIAELAPEVVAAARDWFNDPQRSLFTDPRVRIFEDDGRRTLTALRTQYDLIICDLILPWEAGASALYSTEHYASAAQRLAPGGYYIQWLPLYQLSKSEFLIILNTFRRTFPHVALWRGDFLPDNPIVALVGSEAAALPDAGVIARNAGRHRLFKSSPEDAAATVSLFYAADLSDFADESESRIQTLDRPWLERLSPQTQAQVRIGQAQWFTGADLLRFLRSAQLATIAAHNDGSAERAALFRRSEAGLSLFAAVHYRRAGRTDHAESLYRDFLRRADPGARALFQSAGPGPQRRTPSSRFDRPGP